MKYLQRLEAKRGDICWEGRHFQIYNRLLLDWLDATDCHWDGDGDGDGDGGDGGGGGDDDGKDIQVSGAHKAIQVREPYERLLSAYRWRFFSQDL